MLQNKEVKRLSYYLVLMHKNKPTRKPILNMEDTCKHTLCYNVHMKLLMQGQWARGLIINWIEMKYEWKIKG
jgi:hypothetical protein